MKEIIANVIGKTKQIKMRVYAKVARSKLGICLTEHTKVWYWPDGGFEKNLLQVLSLTRLHSSRVGSQQIIWIVPHFVIVFHVLYQLKLCNVTPANKRTPRTFENCNWRSNFCHQTMSNHPVMMVNYILFSFVRSLNVYVLGYSTGRL